MLQNIIAYTGILLVFSASGYFLYKYQDFLRKYKKSCDITDIDKSSRNLVYAILMLIIGGWVTNAGMAYHVRTMNEAKQEYEAGCQI